MRSILFAMICTFPLGMWEHVRSTDPNTHDTTPKKARVALWNAFHADDVNLEMAENWVKVGQNSWLDVRNGACILETLQWIKVRVVRLAKAVRNTRRIVVASCVRQSVNNIWKTGIPQTSATHFSNRRKSGVHERRQRAHSTREIQRASQSTANHHHYRNSLHLRLCSIWVYFYSLRNSRNANEKCECMALGIAQPWTYIDTVHGAMSVALPTNIISELWLRSDGRGMMLALTYRSDRCRPVVAAYSECPPTWALCWPCRWWLCCCWSPAPGRA